MAISIPTSTVISTSARLCRALSAYSHSNRIWESISPFASSYPETKSAKATRSLSLVTWNVDGFSSRAIARARLILAHVLQESPESIPPDIIFLQEVTSDVRASLLNDSKVRAAWLVTDAEDQTAFDQAPFATMTLLSRARFSYSTVASSQDTGTQKEETGSKKGNIVIGHVSRVPLPSKYSRDALCVDVVHPASAAPVRLINVHLDSLGHAFDYRAQQMKIAASLLREPGCSGGLIAGDFNAISPRDHELINENKLVDAWTALREASGDDGATWGTDRKRRNRQGPGRLDKVAMVGLIPKAVKVLQSGCITVPRPGNESVDIPWSDHHGLRCDFSI